MHAESVALLHCALGIEAEIPGLSDENAASRFSFVRGPLINRRAAGSTVMLLAVGTNPVSASVRWYPPKKNILLRRSGPPTVKPPSFRRAFGLSMPSRS